MHVVRRVGPIVALSVGVPREQRYSRPGAQFGQQAPPLVEAQGCKLIPAATTVRSDRCADCSPSHRGGCLAAPSKSPGSAFRSARPATPTPPSMSTPPCRMDLDDQLLAEV